MSGKILLVTRPFPGGQKTVASLIDMGHQPMAAPLFSKRILPFDVPSPHNMVATIFTSANAVKSVLSTELEIGHQLLPCFTVGDTTAQVAENNGFHNVINTKGDVQDLIAMIKKMGLGGTYFYPCAIDRKPDIENAFAGTEVTIEVTPVYEMIAAKTLPNPVIKQLKEGVIDDVLLYSQRAAEHFVALCRDNQIDISILNFICLSPSIWHTLQTSGAQFGRFADQPNENALFAQIDILSDGKSA
ncbi:uroporphyrinogen-III synthase [Maritalea sp.]|jgi:uroporphyrinogen-III synthase|uniref:uroporphyrinogen-III synthase n=1 Tax=Maritalea sp. TaxID=2003361 RepID=UPI0039E4B7F4